MSISRDLSTPENREYWKFVAETAAEVATWPRWMRGERETSTEYWERKSRMSISDAELREWIRGDRRLHHGNHWIQPMARELLAAREVIKDIAGRKVRIRDPRLDTYVIVDDVEESVDKARAYLAKYGEPGGGE